MRRYYLIALSFLVLAFGWDSLLIKPGRLLAVLVHEFCHGIAAMAGGVQLDLIQIHSNEAGETLVTGKLGFLSFLIAVSAGYLGTAATGASLLWSGLRHSYERTSLAIFILLIFYMSFVFTEPGSTAYLTGLLSSLLLIVLLFLGIEPAGKGLVVIGSF
ncbi:MAG: M50 family metallopeptidase, partial [Leptonema sp. (in: Bacteria)]|nr:M50 family metallopeptidase [Leptonema sp. (in: bacteria)]